MGECGRGGETVKSGEGAREKKKKKKKRRKILFFFAKQMDNGGFDPPTSRMLSVRSISAFRSESEFIGCYQLS